MAFGVYGSVNSKHAPLPRYLSSCRAVTSKYGLDALINLAMKPLSYEAIDVGSRSIIMVNNLFIFYPNSNCMYKYAGEKTYMYTYKFYIHLTFKGSI